MDENEMTMKVMNSAGYQYCKQKQFSNSSENFWHPGFAWAITRKAYEKIGGLYEYAILGSGDNIMLHSLLNNGHNSINSESTQDYKDSIIKFQKNMNKLRFGYTPGVIRHYFHGSKKNRFYGERWKILVVNNYSPIEHIKKDSNGLLVPTFKFPEKLKNEIYGYFSSRNEDNF
jgi:hypothetical protein